MPNASSQVAIVGFGLMGAQIAQVFSIAGFDVRAYDVSPGQINAGLDLIRNGKYGLESAVARGKMARDEAEKAYLRIISTGSIEEACEGSILLIEAAIENLDIKREIFRKAMSVANKNTILATNTSTLSISAISNSFPEQEKSRIAGMHFFNPPQLMKLVEVVRTDKTDTKVIANLEDICRSIRKTPIVVYDVPGFVANRIGISVFAEASYLLENKVATVRDIDLAMRLGYGYPMGPFELGDLVGLDSRLRNMQALYAETKDPRFKPPEILMKLVNEGYLGDPKTKKGSKGGYYEYYQLKRPNEDQ